MEYNDFELLKGISAGDENALEELVRRWYPRIYAYSMKLTGHSQDADDITQDVFVAVLQNVRGFAPWRNFKGWLFTIAHNKCVDYFRIQRRNWTEDISGLDLTDPSPPLDEQTALTDAMENALARLSPIQRETVVLRYYHQFSAVEIARITHTPLPTVKSRLAAAKRTLSALLKEEF